MLGLTTVTHNIEDGDPKPDEAFCSAGDWKYVSPERNKRFARAYIHLAKMLDPDLKITIEEEE